MILSCLSDIRVLGDFVKHPRIHPFYSPIDPLKNTFYLKPSFEQARQQHPIDLLIWWGIQEGVPLDLSEIPVPKAWVISDWHNHWPIVDFARHFNWIFCDQKLKEALTPRVSTQTQVIYRSNYAFVPQFIPPESPHRDIDVLFVGNTLAQKYRQRNQYLLRLAHMDAFKVHIACGISEPEYLHLLTRSKIAFNHTLRQEMNLRAYEATACGAALMMPDDNKEVNFYLQPNQAYIPYNTENLETQIEYYLHHDNERMALAQRAKTALQHHSYTDYFKALMAYLQTQKPFPVPLTPQNTVLSGLLLGLTSDRPACKKNASVFLQSPSIQAPSSSWKRLNALLVIQSEHYNIFPEERLSLHQDLQHTQNQVLKYLDDAKALQDQQSAISLLLRYNLAWSYLYQKNKIAFAQMIPSLMSQDMTELPSLLNQHFFVLPIHSSGFQLLYQETTYHHESELKNILEAGRFFLQGKMFSFQKLNDQAIQAFENCLRQCPFVSEAYFELAALFKQRGQAAKAEQCLAYGLHQGVFYPGVWQAYFSLLRQRSLNNEEKHQLNHLKTALSRLPLFDTQKQ